MRKHSFLKALAGFTLIELIAVIALMTIAASFAVPMIIQNIENRQKDVYKEACAYVISEAASIADSISKGARTISGQSVDTLAGVKVLLNEENEMAYKFNIDITESSDNPNRQYSNNKDTVIVYFKYNPDRTKAFAVGAWYVKKQESTAQIKYDYALAAKLENITDTFTNHKF